MEALSLKKNKKQKNPKNASKYKHKPVITHSITFFAIDTNGKKKQKKNLLDRTLKTQSMTAEAKIIISLFKYFIVPIYNDITEYIFLKYIMW